MAPKNTTMSQDRTKKSLLRAILAPPWDHLGAILAANFDHIFKTSFWKSCKKHCNLHTIGDGGKPDSTRNGKRRSFESSVYCFTHALLVYFPLLLLAFVNVSPLFSHVILLFVNKVPYSSSPLPFFALAL